MSSLERKLAVFCAVSGIVLLFVAASIIGVQGSVTQGAGYALIAGVALLVSYGILDPTAALDLVRSRTARFGSLSVVVTAVVLGILATFNIIASRGDQAADLTLARLYTLAPQSVVVAKKLDSDLTVTGFFRPDETSDRRSVENLLSLYRQQSPRIKVSYLDPDSNPTLASRLGVTIPGSVVLQYKDKPPIVLTLASETESDFTAAMLKLESSRTPVVCWAAGEGERDLKEQNQVFGYSAAAGVIQNQNFKTQDLVLSQATAVPDTCDLVAVVGIQKPLTDQAQKVLGAYLAAGGKLLLAADPWIVDAAAVPSLNAVLQPYGASFDAGLVVEGDSAHAASNDPTTPVVFTYGNSPIAKDLNNQYTFFPQSTAIAGQPPDSVLSVPVAQTSAQSYDIGTPRDALSRQPRDKAGPFTVMETLESAQPAANGKKTRIVLVGTSAIAENRALPPNASGQNDRLLLGALDWLTEQENLIAIAPKPVLNNPLSMTGEQLSFNVFLTVILLPLLMAVIGLAVWWRRRRSYSAPA